MRKIRFRAWYGGEMHSPVFVGGTQVPQVMKAYFRLVNLCAHTEEYHVMQFTGLTDKNGKEIYEGDLLMLRGEEGTSLYTCEWNVNRWSLYPTKGIWVEDLEETYDFEVIGNVYENPELITK